MIKEIRERYKGYMQELEWVGDPLAKDIETLLTLVEEARKAIEVALDEHESKCELGYACENPYKKWLRKVEE